jgi:hypothetical protein
MSEHVTTEDDDLVMVMGMYRLARDSGAKTAVELKKVIRETWPNEPQERLDRNLDTMVRKLIKINHN